MDFELPKLAETVAFQLNDPNHIYELDVPYSVVETSPIWAALASNPDQLPITVNCSLLAFQQFLQLLETRNWSAVTEFHEIQRLADENVVSLPFENLLSVAQDDLLEKLFEAETAELEAHLGLASESERKGIEALILANKIKEIVVRNKDLEEMRTLLQPERHPILDRRLSQLAESVWTNRRDIAAQFFKILGQFK